jgi:ornithine carbamoyltransferase
MNVGAPAGYEPDRNVVQLVKKEAKVSGASINIFNDPKEAAAGADVLYTDVWASMGQEEEAAKRKEVFKSFQINGNLLSLANKGALVMHCLPAHRGEEITAEVIESQNSVVFDEAENRMHVQKAVLIKLLGEKK